MKIIKISSKKQENGLWGNPLNCLSINGLPPHDEKKMLIFSAVIAAFDNRSFDNFYRSFAVYIHPYSNNFFQIKTATGSYNIFYDKYEVDENVLYEFENEQEHTQFLRKQKLKKLKYV